MAWSRHRECRKNFTAAHLAYDIGVTVPLYGKQLQYGRNQQQTDIFITGPPTHSVVCRRLSSSVTRHGEPTGSFTRRPGDDIMPHLV